MSIAIAPDQLSTSKSVAYYNFSVGHDFGDSITTSFSFSPLTDVITGFVNESADDGSTDGAYASLLSIDIRTNPLLPKIGVAETTIDMSSSFFEAHVGTTITFEVVLSSNDPNTGVADGQAIYFVEYKLEPSGPLLTVSPSMIQDDYLAITRLALLSDQATTEANAVRVGTTTERTFVDGLFMQVSGTTIPAVAVEGSMYDHVGTSNEITKLATVFLPPQVANATQLGLDAQVYACEALGLAFAFGDENGATTFDTNFGPSNPETRATPAGDVAFATEASNAIFGSAANANTPNAILGFVTNWEAFFSHFGVPGIGTSATVSQIDLAARGAAWGDAVGVALENNLGPLPGEVINFLEDAARGGALYSKSFASQPSHAPFEGEIPEFLTSSADVQLTGVAAPDHMLM